MSDSSLLIIDAVVPEELRGEPGTLGHAVTDSLDSRLIVIEADQESARHRTVRNGDPGTGIQAFAFNLVLDRTAFDEADVGRLYARCKDGTLVTAGDVSYVDFDRHADSLENAIRSAIADVQAAGFRVRRVEIETDGLTPQPA
jgi:hypothetical protein